MNINQKKFGFWSIFLLDINSVMKCKAAFYNNAALPDRIKGGDTMFRRAIFGLLTLSILAAGSVSTAQAVTPYSVKYAAANVEQYAAKDQGTSQDKENSARQGKDQDKKKCCPDEDE